MIEGLKLDPAILPRVYESPEVTGRVSEVAAALTGLKPGTPVVGGGGDPGQLRRRQRYRRTRHRQRHPRHLRRRLRPISTSPPRTPPKAASTPCHAVPGKWHVMGVTQGAGLSLQWFRNQLAPAESYDELTALAATAPALSQGLYWMPYLMGERTPHVDAYARAAWIGLTAKHTRADMVRALLEGVTYSQKDCLVLVERMGARVDKVRLSGGGAKSPFWRQMFADAFDKTIATLETQEGSAYGAGLLAMVGSGRFPLGRSRLPRRHPRDHHRHARPRRRRHLRPRL